MELCEGCGCLLGESGYVHICHFWRLRALFHAALLEGEPLLHLHDAPHRVLVGYSDLLAALLLAVEELHVFELDRVQRDVVDC